MKIQPSFVVVLVLLVTSGCSKAAAGSISGMVIDSGSGIPVPAASVSTEPPTSAVTTDAGGYYSISQVLPGQYLVSASKTGYNSASVKIAVSAGQTTTADIPLVISLASDRSTGKPNSPGLVAYWSFDDGTATDNSGNGHHGTVHSATLVEDRHRNPRHAYYFDGENSFIKVQSDPDLANIENQMSIAAWIRVDPETRYEIYDLRHILAKGATYGDLWADYALGLSNPEGALAWEFSDYSNAPFRTNTSLTISQGKWHHAVVTFDGQSIRLYLDAQLQKTLPGPYNAFRRSSQPLYIGCRYENPIVGVFKGSIDEVRIYNYSFSEANILELYQLD